MTIVSNWFTPGDTPLELKDNAARPLSFTSRTQSVQHPVALADLSGSRGRRDKARAKARELRTDLFKLVGGQKPAQPRAGPSVRLDLSGRWRVERCGGYHASNCGGGVEGFARAMGASFLTRKAFMAAVALLNKSVMSKYYTVRQHGDTFTIIVNDGDRLVQHVECFTAGVDVVQNGEAWYDPFANAKVRVAAAWWNGRALRTRVNFVSMSSKAECLAYEAEWRLHGEQLRYTMSCGDESIWVLMELQWRGSEEPLADAPAMKSRGANHSRVISERCTVRQLCPG